LARSAPSAFPDKQAATMPRYFFNMMEGRSHNLVRDIDGVQFADVDEAREEAIGLARDITSHGLSESMQTWTVVVTDESGTEVLTVPLAQIGTRKVQASHAAGHVIGRGLARLESRLRRGAVIWVMAAVALAIVLQAGLIKMEMAQYSGYQTASAELGVSEGAVAALPVAGQHRRDQQIPRGVRWHHDRRAERRRPLPRAHRRCEPATGGACQDHQPHGAGAGRRVRRCGRISRRTQSAKSFLRGCVDIFPGRRFYTISTHRLLH
jgi:hypothetical protein